VLSFSGSGAGEEGSEGGGVGGGADSVVAGTAGVAAAAGWDSELVVSPAAQPDRATTAMAIITAVDAFMPDPLLEKTPESEHTSRMCPLLRIHNEGRPVARPDKKGGV
jgi:hypothetical protein